MVCNISTTILLDSLIHPEPFGHLLLAITSLPSSRQSVCHAVLGMSMQRYPEGLKINSFASNTPADRFCSYATTFPNSE